MNEKARKGRDRCIRRRGLMKLDWLDRVVKKKEQFVVTDSLHSWNILNKYHHTSEMIKLEQTIRANAM